MSLGKRTEFIREYLDITQAQLAAKASTYYGETISQQALGALESRDSKRSRFSSAIAQALEINEDWLINGDDSLEGITSELALIGRNIYHSRLSINYSYADFIKELVTHAYINFFSVELVEMGFELHEGLFSPNDVANNSSKFEEYRTIVATSPDNIKLIKAIENGTCHTLLDNRLLKIFIELCSITLQVMPDTLQFAFIHSSATRSDDDEQSTINTLENMKGQVSPKSQKNLQFMIDSVNKGYIDEKNLNIVTELFRQLASVKDDVNNEKNSNN